MPTRFHKQRGLSLVEWMMASWIGVILSIALFQSFSILKRIMHAQQQLMQTQESLHASTFIIGQAIRKAGWMGGMHWKDLRLAAPFSLNTVGLASKKVVHKMSIAQLKAHPYIPRSMIARIKANTDILWVIGSEPIEKGRIDPKDSYILVNEHDQTMTVYRWPLPFHSRALSTPAGLRKLSSTFYYVSQDNALYSMQLHHPSQPEVSGVEDLKIDLEANKITLHFTFQSLQWAHEWAIY